MQRNELSEYQAAKIISFLRQCAGVKVGDQQRWLRFVQAVLWIMRTGAQWRELPERFGKWNSIYERHPGYPSLVRARGLGPVA